MNEATIESAEIRSLLTSLYQDAERQDPLAWRGPEIPGVPRMAYMAVNREFGKLLYSLVRLRRAKTVVEFGTSFGVSTIFLAAALRDNGGGRLITTELEPEKAERAKRNLTAAGLVDLVEFRTGDARASLASDPAEIDLLFLDGEKSLYFEVLQLLEPRLSPGAVVASDNTDRPELRGFLAYLRDPANGYTSAAIATRTEHEVSLRHSSGF